MKHEGDLSVEKGAAMSIEAMRRQLVRIHDALCSHLGDTDPWIDEDMTDEEICEEMPVFWAAKEIAALMGDAPWTGCTRPKPSQPAESCADAKSLSLELLGVITDVEQGNGFDDVCLQTIKRVYSQLSAKCAGKT